jgi:hypothetical protein
MQWSVVKPLTLMQADVSGLGAMLSRPGYRNDGWRQMPNWGFASLTCICSSSHPQRPAEQSKARDRSHTPYPSLNASAILATCPGSHSLLPAFPPFAAFFDPPR